MGARLHLVHPLGFELDDTKLKRAGLDYHEWASVSEYPSFSEMLKAISPNRLFACTTKGQTSYDCPDFMPGDAFIFGPESRGLPKEILDSLIESHRLYIPMVSESRSLNLSNAVALVLYEAWRKNAFTGAAVRL